MYQEKFTIIMNFKEIIKQEWEKPRGSNVECYVLKESILKLKL